MIIHPRRKLKSNVTQENIDIATKEYKIATWKLRDSVKYKSEIDKLNKEIDSLKKVKH